MLGTLTFNQDGVGSNPSWLGDMMYLISSALHLSLSQVYPFRAGWVEQNGGRCCCVEEVCEEIDKCDTLDNRGCPRILGVRRRLKMTGGH